MLKCGEVVLPEPANYLRLLVFTKSTYSYRDYYGGIEMDKTIEDSGNPYLTEISRRKFLKLIALSGNAVVLGAASMSLISCSRSKAPAAMDDIPIRNPAFHEIPSDLENHTILYCQTADSKYLAYDLNPSGYLIWRQCVDHSEFIKDVRKNISQLASEVAGYCKMKAVQDFVSLMYSKGLVYSGKQAKKAYFVFEGRY